MPSYVQGSSVPYSNMSSTPTSSMNTSWNGQINPNNDRLVGGFLGPFILGGVTGGLLAPAFYPRPYYNNNYYPYPYYGPYYR